MKYLDRFLVPSNSEDIGGDPPTKPTKPPVRHLDSDKSLGRAPYETYETAPDPLAALTGPRRTTWGTLAWSDPDAPPIGLFGPPDLT